MSRNPGVVHSPASVGAGVLFLDFAVEDVCRAWCSNTRTECMIMRYIESCGDPTRVTSVRPSNRGNPRRLVARLTSPYVEAGVPMFSVQKRNKTTFLRGGGERRNG